MRYVAATNDEYTWAYEPAESAVGNSNFWPLLTGLQIASGATKPQPRADIYALGSAGPDHNQFQNGIGNFEQMNPRKVGLDATVPFTNTLAFVGTINPDFSNVEQDQTTIAPQEFQRQYNEYRPFFAQGSGFVSALPGVNVNSFYSMFYTPSIGVFNRGLKVEGTTGQSAVGALNVTGDGFNDSAFGYNFQHPDESLIAAFQGVDANHNGVIDDAYGVGLGSINPHSGALAVADYETDRGTNVTTPSQGNYFNSAFGVQNARENFLLSYRDIGAQFAPVDGYTQTNDVLGPQISLQYNGVGNKDGNLQSYQLYAGADRFVDLTGAAHEADVVAVASAVLKNLFGFGYTVSTSELRSYVNAYPFYTGGSTLAYNSQTINLNYKNSSPTPVAFTYGRGPFGGLYTQQMDLSTTQVCGLYALSLEYGSNVVRPIPGVTALLPDGSPAPALDSQWLRRISIARSFGKNASIAIGLRGINGDGGYAAPGTNLALSFHDRFPNRNELYVDYGTPAAPQTLHRFLAKYIFHLGGQTGT